MLRAEVDKLRRFSELASGAHRFARWRIWVAAVQRKRAEHRAAMAHAARRPAIAPPELLDQLRQRLTGARRRAILALTGGVREACLRILWRWRAAVIAMAGRAAVTDAATAAAAAAVGPAAAAAARSEAAVYAAHDEILWARESSKRAADAEGMLHEAIAVGDAQTRRVLQLQRAVSATRRTLAACLLRSSLSAVGRARCAHAIHRWALSISAHAKQRAVLDAKAARDGANRARDTAKASEGFARDAQEGASREVADVKKRLAAAEKSRGALRDQVHGLGSELEAARRQHETARDEYERRLGAIERSNEAHEARSQQLEVVQGQRMELELQLRSLRHKLKQSALLLPPAAEATEDGASESLVLEDDRESFVAAASPSLTPRMSAAPPSSARSGRRSSVGDDGAAAAATHKAVRQATAELQVQLEAQMREKEQALSLRTKAVRDLKTSRDALQRGESKLREVERQAVLARLLAHARSRIGRPAQLLRLLAALRDWWVACRVLADTAFVAGPGEGASRRVGAAWTTPATGAAPSKQGPPPPHGWAMALRASRLSELRVRVQNRALAWSLRARYRALLCWRELFLTGSPSQIGWAAGGDDARLRALLDEVTDMKAAVHQSTSSSGRTPGSVRSATRR